MVGIIERVARPAKAEQQVRHVQAGNIGRLVRVCMAVAREEGAWEAVGPVEDIDTPQGRQFRQKLMRRNG